MVRVTFPMHCINGFQLFGTDSAASSITASNPEEKSRTDQYFQQNASDVCVMIQGMRKD